MDRVRAQQLVPTRLLSPSLRRSVSRSVRFGLSLSLCLSVSLSVTGCARQRSEVVLAPYPAPVSRPSTPIQFPRDEAPHDNLTEWWYYTGHLKTDDGRRFGFELVFFQTVRGDYPVQYLAQFAITDPARDAFQHASRTAQGSQIGRHDGFDLAVAEWRMSGALGRDELQASMDNYSLSLQLRSEKPAGLHDHDGLVSFGAAGDSYYYSYTRMMVEGTLVDRGEPLAVRGQAWFDHQWGDFLVLGGGWDWFSAQLGDGSEIMLNHLRDDHDRVVGIWGTYVDPGGGFRALGSDDFTIESTGRWTSPKSGGIYPMGWNVTLRDPPYRLQFTPVLLDQELVSEAVGLTYWEGANDIEGTRAGAAVTGQGYVELTGYSKR
jgi:predicted secreted hydrolase